MFKLKAQKDCFGILMVVVGDDDLPDIALPKKAGYQRSLLFDSLAVSRGWLTFCLFFHLAYLYELWCEWGLRAHLCISCSLNFSYNNTNIKAIIMYPSVYRLSAQEFICTFKLALYVFCLFQYTYPDFVHLSSWLSKEVKLQEFLGTDGAAAEGSKNWKWCCVVFFMLIWTLGMNLAQFTDLLSVTSYVFYTAWLLLFSVFR